jgi:hypothetical protein
MKTKTKSVGLIVPQSRLMERKSSSLCARKAQDKPVKYRRKTKRPWKIRPKKKALGKRIN